MNLEVGRNPHLGYFMEPRAVSLGPRTVTKTKITKEECTFISTLKQSPPPPPPLEVPGTYIVLEWFNNNTHGLTTTHIVVSDDTLREKWMIIQNKSRVMTGINISCIDTPRRTLLSNFLVNRLKKLLGHRNTYLQQYSLTHQQLFTKQNSDRTKRKELKTYSGVYMFRTQEWDDHIFYISLFNNFLVWWWNELFVFPPQKLLIACYNRRSTIHSFVRFISLRSLLYANHFPNLKDWSTRTNFNHNQKYTFLTRPKWVHVDMILNLFDSNRIWRKNSKFGTIEEGTNEERRGSSVGEDEIGTSFSSVDPIGCIFLLQNHLSKRNQNQETDRSNRGFPSSVFVEEDYYYINSLWGLSVFLDLRLYLGLRRVKIEADLLWQIVAYLFLFSVYVERVSSTCCVVLLYSFFFFGLFFLFFSSFCWNNFYKTLLMYKIGLMTYSP